MATRDERLSDLFSAALEFKPEERAAFLDRECNSDAELRRELEALLAAPMQMPAAFSNIRVKTSATY